MRQFQPRNSAETVGGISFPDHDCRPLASAAHVGTKLPAFKRRWPARRNRPHPLERAPSSPPPPFAAWPTTPAPSPCSSGSKPPMTANTTTPSPCF
jgi:hypothetical protein